MTEDSENTERSYGSFPEGAERIGAPRDGKLSTRPRVPVDDSPPPLVSPTYAVPPAKADPGGADPGWADPAELEPTSGDPYFGEPADAWPVGGRPQAASSGSGALGGSWAPADVWGPTESPAAGAADVWGPTEVSHAAAPDSGGGPGLGTGDVWAAGGVPEGSTPGSGAPTESWATSGGATSADEWSPSGTPGETWASDRPGGGAPADAWAAGRPGGVAPADAWAAGRPEGGASGDAWADGRPEGRAPADAWGPDTGAYGPGVGAQQAPGGYAHGAAPSGGDPFGLPGAGRRIEPTPPPGSSRLVPGLIAGLVAGLLVFGGAGWFVGRATAPAKANTAATTKATTKATATLGAWEQSQITVNRPDFAGTGLVTISAGWLPYLSTCVRSGRPHGPALNQGEKVRVRCTLDGMSAIFVEYKSIAERDRARQRMQDPSQNTPSLAPGIGPAVQRATPSGRTEGNYVEYAYRLTDDGTPRTVGGIWWDDAKTPIAGYLLAFWKEGVAESWAPMRDLWSRYA